ncbi:MAG: glycosyl hydrolase family 28 protein [Chitinophagales bacterium]|nr:glycosyl hydrolase family 28 protein [Chitinophagales bacterium]
MRLQLLFILIAPLSSAQTVLDVRNFGAVGNGSTLNTAAIQQAIDSASALGGAVVLLTNGTYKSSTIRMKSNVTLRITADATLLAVSNYSDYPDIPYNRPSWSDTYTKRSLLFAEEADNIRITGGGTIDCAGFNFAYLQTPTKQRPFGVRIHACINVTIDSVEFKTAPQWMVHIMRSQNIHIHHISIFNHGFGANDGIDIDCCRNVLIEDCVIDSNDDPIAIKTHSEDTCRDVLVRNCEIATFERGVKVGNESQGPLINIRFEDITIRETDFTLKLPPQSAVYLAIADGGSADSISFERINVVTSYDTPIFIRLCNRGQHYDTLAPPPTVKFLRNVLVKDVICTAKTVIPSSITGIPGHNVENVRLQNIEFVSPGNGPLVSSNVPEQETNRPENDIWGDSLPAYGLYVRHVDGLVLDSFCVELQNPDQRGMLYFEDTSEVAVIGKCSPFVSIGTPKKNDKNDLRVFPMPAKNSLRIEGLPSNEYLRLDVMNMTGQTVFSHCFQHLSTYAELDISKFVPGIYLLTVKNGKQTHSVRFIKN